MFYNPFSIRNHLVAENRSPFKVALIKRRFIVIMHGNLSDLHCMAQTGLASLPFFPAHHFHLQGSFYLPLTHLPGYLLALIQHDLSALVLMPPHQITYLCEWT